MAQTLIGLNDAKAVKRFSSMLAVDVAKNSYFTSRMMGKGEGTSMPLMVLTELENAPGEQISYDLSVQLSGTPTEGDDRDEGREEKLAFYSDNIYIDQQRKSVSSGGRMTRKRTLHDLRVIAKRRQTEYWARLFDEEIFIYLSGARGINTDFIQPTSYTGRANNSLSAPDTDHILYGDGGAKATLTVNGKMSLAVIDRAVAKADTMGGGIQKTPKIQPVNVEGESKFVCVMNPFQAYDLRTATGDGGWLDIQKALHTSAAKNNPISKGGLGEHNGVVLHKHQSVLRFSDYGSGTNIAAARALFLGAQAGCIAFGQAGKGLRYSWHEEEQDRGNELVVTTNTIWGCKKATYNSKDFGVVALDTAAADPNA